MNRHTLTACLALLILSAGSAHAQEWARKMFKVQTHDFGVVARGSKQEFRFKFENLYEEDIHIASVRSSCGCTSPTVTKDTLKTWEKADIIAKYNTRSFLGQKGATITVTIDRPYYAEVQLTVRGFIRGDVVFEPGAVSFGEVEEGQPAEQRVQISYAGRPNWAIHDVRSASESFEVELDELNRGGGRVAYEMLVRLKPNAAPGFFKDQLTLITDDSNNSRIPLLVEGKVTPAITVYPQLLTFTGKVGEDSRKQLVIRGKKPFRITKIDCGDECLQFKLPEEAKKVHVVPVVFTPGDMSRDIDEEIRIGTDFAGGVSVACRIMAKAE